MARTRETLFTLTDRDGDELLLDHFSGGDEPDTYYLSVHSDTYGTQPVSLQPAQLEDLGNHLLSHGNRITPRCIQPAPHTGYIQPAPHTGWTHIDPEGDMLAVELLDRVTEDPYHEVYLTAQGSYANGEPVTVYLDQAALLETGQRLLDAVRESALAADNG